MYNDSIGEMTMKLGKLHHIAIIGSNLEKSKHFYIDLLGFTCIREIYREKIGDYKIDLQLNNYELELFIKPDCPPRPNYPEAYGLRHIAFYVEDIENTVRELENKGIEVEPIRLDEITNKKMTFFKDPDGLPIELHE